MQQIRKANCIPLRWSFLLSSSLLITWIFFLLSYLFDLGYVLLPTISISTIGTWCLLRSSMEYHTMTRLVEVRSLPTDIRFKLKLSFRSIQDGYPNKRKSHKTNQSISKYLEFQSNLTLPQVKSKSQTISSKSDLVQYTWTPL